MTTQEFMLFAVGSIIFFFVFPMTMKIVVKVTEGFSLKKFWKHRKYL